MALRLLVISPVRDEAAHLERVVEGMASQLRPPDRWLIVDDGSTDGTLELARAAAQRLDFCEVLEAPAADGAPPDTDGRLAAAAEARAFSWALEQAGTNDFDAVAKLDGDIVLPPEWFADLLDRLEADPSLGIVGGTLRELGRGGGMVQLREPDDHVAGAVKLYRREVLEQIGGLRPYLGWDTVDELHARHRGYVVRSFRTPQALHLRPCGAGGRPLAGRARYGRAAYLLHQPLWWAALRAIKLLRTRPLVLSTIAFMAGYLRAAAARAPRIDDPVVRSSVRASIGRRVQGGADAVDDAAPAEASADHLRALLITPMRNEAAHVEAVVAAMVAQTTPPALWAIVDDDSTDGTGEALERLTADVPWIRVLRAPKDLTPATKDRLAAAAAPRVFRWALEQVGLDGFDLVGKLDGDIALPPDYLRILLRRMAADGTLGIAGGVRVERHGDSVRQLDRAGEHVPGGLKLYRADCYRRIGGMPELLGWDAIDEVLAHMEGYTTRSYGDLITHHHRHWGTADGRLRGRVRIGRAYYCAGYPFPAVAASSLRMGLLKPYGISTLAVIHGYAWSGLRRGPRMVDRRYRNQLRRELLHKAARRVVRR